MSKKAICATLFFIGMSPILCTDSSFAQDSLFRSLFTKKMPARQNVATSYRLDDGFGFVIDRTRRDQILLKYNYSEEIFVLTSNFGARGDEFLNNDIGETLFRISTLGGVTYYRAGDSNGKPAIEIGRAKAIMPLENIHNIKVQNAVQLAQGSLTRFKSAGIAMNRIEFNSTIPQPLVRDSLARILDSFKQCRNPQIAKSINSIRIDRAFQKYVTLRGNSLQLGVTPGIDYAGRPSSRAISKSLGCF